jgi:hypothetical protein
VVFHNCPFADQADQANNFESLRCVLSYSAQGASVVHNLRSILMDRKMAKFFAGFMTTAFLIGSAFIAAGIIR